MNSSDGAAEKNPLVCREAERRDVSELVGFQLAMAAETEGLTLDPATVLGGVGAVFDHPARGRYFVAEAAGRIVGGLLITVEWSDWRNGEVWWLQSVYVIPSARRQGVFRALYAHVRALVEARPELHGLRLYVHQANLRARNTYVAMGMNADHYAVCEWMKSF